MSSDLQASESISAELDCRVHERLACDLPAICQPASVSEAHEMRWRASIVDISQGGVQIHLPRRFERGTGLALELPGTAERESNIVFIKVVHLHALPDHTWSLGCKFVSPLSDDEIGRLLLAKDHVFTSLQKSHHDEELSDAIHE